MTAQLPADPVVEVEAKTATKAIKCTLPRGDTVTGYMCSETSFFWVFENTKGNVTKVRLSLDAVHAIAQITDELLNPTEDAA